MLSRYSYYWTVWNTMLLFFCFVFKVSKWSLFHAILCSLGVLHTYFCCCNVCHLAQFFTCWAVLEKETGVVVSAKFAVWSLHVYHATRFYMEDTSHHERNVCGMNGCVFVNFPRTTSVTRSPRTLWSQTVSHGRMLRERLVYNYSQVLVSPAAVCR